MAVKIRLKRTGRHKLASYRIVVADSRYPRDGRFIEELGIYQPMNEKPVIKIDHAKAIKWLGEGAQPSDTVKNILDREGILKEFRANKEAK